jgi:adenosine deaminase
VPITVNTDTPAMFGTTMGDETTLLHTQFGLDVASIDAIVLNGPRASFLPHERKAALVKTFEAELPVLKASFLS